jgi:hypothetical protein
VVKDPVFVGQLGLGEWVDPVDAEVAEEEISKETLTVPVLLSQLLSELAGLIFGGVVDIVGHSVLGSIK